MKNQANLPLLNDGSFRDFTQADLIKRLIKSDNFQQLISQHYTDPDTRHDYKRWQWTVFVQKSWQVSALGFTFFRSYYQSFSAYNEVNNLITGNVILGLNNIIKGPWAIRRNVIYTWNPDIYFEIKMFDGNVHEFLLFNDQKNR